MTNQKHKVVPGKNMVDRCLCLVRSIEEIEWIPNKSSKKMGRTWKCVKWCWIIAIDAHLMVKQVIMYANDRSNSENLNYKTSNRQSYQMQHNMTDLMSRNDNHCIKPKTYQNISNVVRNINLSDPIYSDRKMKSSNWRSEFKMRKSNPNPPNEIPNLEDKIIKNHGIWNTWKNFMKIFLNSNKIKTTNRFFNRLAHKIITCD